MLTISNPTSHLVMLCIAGFPMVAAFSALTTLSSTPLAVTLRAIIALTGIALWTRSILKIQHRGYQRNIANTAFTIFWCVYLLRLGIDTTINTNSLSRDPMEYWIWAIGACLIPAIALKTSASSKDIQKSYYLTAAVTLITALITTLLSNTQYTIASGDTLDIGRLSLPSLNPISLGHLGLSLIILCTLPPKSDSKNPRQFRKVTRIAGITIGGYLLLGSASRGPLVALIVTTGIFLVATRKLKIRQMILPLIASIIVAVSINSYLEENTSIRVTARLEASTEGVDDSIIGRQIAYAGAISQFLSHPIAGDYIEERITKYYPHNIILESFMATGIVGGVSLLIILMHCAITSFRIIQSDRNLAWAGLLYFQYLVGAQFTGALYNTTTLWALIGIVMSIHRQRQSKITSKWTSKPPQNPCIKYGEDEL